MFMFKSFRFCLHMLKRNCLICNFRPSLINVSIDKLYTNVPYTMKVFTIYIKTE